MEASGSQRKPLEAFGSMWKPLEAPGGLWKLLEAFESLWELLEAKIVVQPELDQLRVEPLVAHRRRALDISCSSGSKSRLVGPRSDEGNFGSSGPGRTSQGTLVELQDQVEKVLLTKV